MFHHQKELQYEVKLERLEDSLLAQKIQEIRWSVW